LRLRGAGEARGPGPEIPIRSSRFRSAVWMLELASPEGYRSLKCVQQRPFDALYAAVRDADERPVTLYVFAASGRRLHDEARARHVIDMLSVLAGSGIPRVIEGLASHEPALIVLEALPQLSLDLWCDAAAPIDVLQFLQVALQLTSILERAHQRHLIHGGLCSSNVWIDARTLEVYMVDVESAERIGWDESAESRQAVYRRSTQDLRYIAPERTGRMGRHYDHRSDLYSLGCVLHRILVEAPPFEETDELALIHAHIARMPMPVAGARADVPEVLAEIIGRLLNKDPEGRYQSASALYADLEACVFELRQHGSISGMAMSGGGRAASMPSFPDRLYGRERELTALRAAYEACANGATQTVLIGGAPGMGRTALLDSICRLARSQGACVARARFGPGADHPYAGWTTAVTSVVEKLLLESNEQLEYWRRRLLDGLGSVAGALVAWAPDLGIILGQTPPLPDLGPSATRARLSLALQRFVRVAARPGHPFVLALDDLHRSEPGSCALLEELLVEQRTPCLLVIGTYRCAMVGGSGEPNPTQFDSFVSSLQRSVRDVALVKLRPLSDEATAAMIADALHRTPADVASLRETLEIKTGNSPLLIRQFIAHVCERGLLRYEAEAGWSWTPNELAAADVPDEAVALMTARLGRLAGPVHELIRTSSCVGEVFDLELVSRLTQTDQRGLESAVLDAVTAGLIVPCAHGYRFVHSRVREVAYGQLGDAERVGLHAQIARALIGKPGDDLRAEELLAAADHANLGRVSKGSLAPSQVLDVNLRAAHYCSASGSSVVAGRYLAAARNLLTEEDWAERRDVALETMTSSVECELDENRPHEALALVEALHEQPLAESDLLRVSILRLRVLALLEAPSTCVEAALQVLRKLGVTWPARPSYLRTRWELWRTSMMLELHGHQVMLREPTEKPEQLDAILRVLTVAGAAFVLHDVRLAMLSSCYAIRCFLRFGKVTPPGYRFATFAAFAYVFEGKPASARSRAALALEWNKEAPHPWLGPRIEYVVYALIQPWVAPRRTVIAPLGRIAESIRETGDPEYFQFARYVRVLYRALAGDTIVDVAQHFGLLAETTLRSRPWYEEARSSYEAYELLTALPTSRDDLPGKLAASFAAIRGDAPHLSTIWMLVLCFYGEYGMAFDESERIGEQLHLSCPFAHVADHVFYRGVAAARMAGRVSGDEGRRYRVALRDSLKRMQEWARGGPDFVHMADILGAEAARLDACGERAAKLYDRAARRAERQAFLHHAALVHEFRAGLMQETGRQVTAAHALREAVRLYACWGAPKKAQALKRSL